MCIIPSLQQSSLVELPGCRGRQTSAILHPDVGCVCQPATRKYGEFSRIRNDLAATVGSVVLKQAKMAEAFLKGALKHIFLPSHRLVWLN